MRLKFLADVVAGQSPPSEDVTDLNGGIPFLQGNAEFGDRHPTPKLQVENPPKRANEGDILVSVRAPVGALNIADQPFGIGRGLAAVRAVRCDRGFLWWWFHAQVGLLDSESTGTTFKAIVAADLSNLEFPAVGLDEQRAIADYLDQETAQIDALVAKQEEFIRLLRERRLSQITGAFSRLGEPNSELRRVAHVQSGVTLSGEGDPRHPTWPYLRVANVQMGRVDLEEVKEIRLSPGDAQASMLRAGDVLMTEGGDIDKLGRGTVWDGSIDPIVHQNHVFAVRVNRDRLVPEYLAWWLDSVTSRRYFYLTAKKTTNLASTNKTVVGRLPVSVPSVDEQRAIVRRIEEQTSRIDTLIAKAEEHIALAKERRSALITAAVTGQFDVRTARKAG